MRKAVLEGARKFVIRDVPKPDLVPESLLLKVRYTSICGTDIHIWQWGPEPKDAEVIRLFEAWSEVFFGFPPAFILGHQMSGEIAETNAGGEQFKKGDRITVRAPGGYAEYVRIKGLGGGPLSAAVYPLPEEVTYEQAALVEPLSVAFDAVRRSRLNLGDVVVVQGAGAIGLLLLQCAKIAGARQVIVSEVSELRIEKAKELGADMVVNPREENVVERIHELTDGFGPDIVYDCAGNGEATRTTLNISPAGRGKVVIMSTYEHPLEIDFNLIMMKNLEIIGFLSGLPGSYEPQCDPFKIAIELIRSGKVKVDPLISAVVPLEKINETFMALSKAEDMVVLVKL